MRDTITQAVIDLFQAYLDEDTKLELNGAPLEYRHDLLRAAMHWKIKELEREKNNA